MSQQVLAYRTAIEYALDAARKAGAELLSPELVAHLGEEHLKRSPTERYLFAHNSPRVGRPELVRWLLDRSFALRHQDPHRMLSIAEVAVEVADALRSGARLRAIVWDLRAEAWGNLANARMIVGDLRGADRAWREAKAGLLRGSQDPILRGHLCYLEASLRHHLRESVVEAALLEEAAALFGQAGEAHRHAMCLLKLARTAFEEGSLERALHHLIGAGARADETIGPGSVAMVLQTLAVHLERRGSPQETLLLLHLAHDAFSRRADRLLAPRLYWLEARILTGLGYHAEAATVLEAVRARFVEEKLAFTASHAAMELAQIYTRLERADLVEQLAEEMYPVFLSQELPVEATAALTLFVKAAKRRRATMGRIATVLGTLKDLEKRGATQNRTSRSG
jgi:hypothetical protein